MNKGDSSVQSTVLRSHVLDASIETHGDVNYPKGINKYTKVLQ
jgi:hypothetical protein